MFKNYIWKYDPRILNWCQMVAYQIVDNDIVGWKRKGSWMEKWYGKRRLSLAPHKFGLSLYFNNRDRIPLLYKEMGGICNVGKCTINFVYGKKYDIELVKDILKIYVQGKK